MDTARKIEQDLTLWAARQPRTEAAALMLAAVEAIQALREDLQRLQAEVDTKDSIHE